MDVTASPVPSRNRAWCLLLNILISKDLHRSCGRLCTKAAFQMLPKGYGGNVKGGRMKQRGPQGGEWAK